MQAAPLSEAAQRLGVELDELQCGRLARYVALLEKWNAHFNLVSRKDIARLWTRHILDSLSVLPIIREQFISAARRGEVADVGTGAGFPGLPLAVVATELDWLLLDRNARKIRFLELVIAELGLTNVQAHCVDIGSRAPLSRDLRADLIVSRAVDDAAGLARSCAGLLGGGGAMILMTGTTSTAGYKEADVETAERVSAGYHLESVREVEIAELGRTHQVSVIRKT